MVIKKKCGHNYHPFYCFCVLANVRIEDFNAKSKKEVEERVPY